MHCEPGGTCRAITATGSAAIARSLSDLHGLEVEARDGRVGYLSEVLLEARGWTVRWAVVEGVGSVEGAALVPPGAIRHIDDAAGTVALDLPRERLQEPVDPAGGPGERTRLAGWPLEWGGVGVWGPAAEPAGPLPVPASLQAGDAPGRLHSSADLIGARVEGLADDAGWVADLLVDDARWRLEGVVVETPAGRVVLAPEAISEVDGALGLIRVRRVASPLGRPMGEDVP